MVSLGGDSLDCSQMQQDLPGFGLFPLLPVNYADSSTHKTAGPWLQMGEEREQGEISVVSLDYSPGPHEKKKKAN